MNNNLLSLNCVPCPLPSSVEATRRHDMDRSDKKSSYPPELLEADDCLLARLHSPVRCGPSAATKLPLFDMLNHHGHSFRQNGWEEPSSKPLQRPRKGYHQDQGDEGASTPSPSNNSIDTRTLLESIDNFSLYRDENDNHYRTDQEDRSLPPPRTSHTPRLDNRSVHAARGHSLATPLEEPVRDGLNHKEEGLMQEWFSRWRAAVQEWVQAQKFHHDQQHEHLREQLHCALRQQHESISDLQAVVESQQEVLEQFLSTHQQYAGKSHHGRVTRVKPAGPGTSIQGFVAEEMLQSLPLQETSRCAPNKPQHRPTSTSSQSTRQHERLSDGTRITVYANGTRKEQRDDGCCVIHFDNGDIQTVGLDGKTAYWFASTKVVRVEELDCTLYQFPNGQIERHYPDGRKFVQFPNNRCRWVDA